MLETIPLTFLTFAFVLSTSFSVFFSFITFLFVGLGGTNFLAHLTSPHLMILLFLLLGLGHIDPFSPVDTVKGHMLI